MGTEPDGEMCMRMGAGLLSSHGAAPAWHHWCSMGFRAHCTLTQNRGPTGPERGTHMSKKHPTTAVGTFSNPADARAAIEALRKADFDDDNIGILTHDKDGDPDVKSFKDMAGNKAGTGAVAGVAAGVGTGTLWALGIAAGLLPAIGPVIAGGLLAAVASSAAIGAAAGGLVGALVGLGITDEEAVHYNEEFKTGKTIVVVKGEKITEAYLILQKHNSTNRFASNYI